MLVLNGFHVPVGIGFTKTVLKTKSLMQVGFVLCVCANGSYYVHDTCAHELYVFIVLIHAFIKNILLQSGL